MAAMDNAAALLQSSERGRRGREEAHLERRLVRARRAFDRYDVDSSGTLDSAELATLAEWVFTREHPEIGEATPGQREALVGTFMSAADENGDGVLDFDEFAGLYRDLTKTLKGLARKRRKVRLPPWCRRVLATAPPRHSPPLPPPKAKKKEKKLARREAKVLYAQGQELLEDRASRSAIDVFRAASLLDVRLPPLHLAFEAY